ncbi:MAG: 2Fe-2S iron-sulfur cluster-binding protein [Chitinophagales bacterium]|nr:2Fe-2S iron-sulfur cluster-binding protein [Chitinophagales bacterium]
MESIEIFIEDKDGTEKILEIPLGIQMSLMEVLRGENENIQGICGGMAICATCVIELLNKDELEIPEMQDDELSVLESLPEHSENSRLACQIPISEKLHHLHIRVPETVFV